MYRLTQFLKIRKGTLNGGFKKEWNTKRLAERIEQIESFFPQNN